MGSGWCIQLYGNGKDMAEQAFLGEGTPSLFAALAVLKPLVTALCLGSGMAGGLFTPTLSTGAMLGAAAFIGAATQAPLAGLVLVLVLTHSGVDLLVPMILATVVATVIARWIDGYSIYSARLEGR